MQKVVEVCFLDLEEKKELINFAENVINECFKEEKMSDLNFYVSVTLTSPKQIHELNRKYRNVDRPTDVLSFPMFEKDELERIITEKLKNVVPEVLGDIVISVEKVEEQAKEYGHSFERELSYMLVHGFYHIMGYDHIEEEDKVQMREKEENILKKLKQSR